MRTRAQRWAEDAYNRVKARAQGDQAQKYKDMALLFPILVRPAGLSQALALVGCRGEEAHKNFVGDLARTLGHEGLEALAEEARIAELPAYLRLTREVLGAAEWYKRFAQALIEEEK
jgi:CRISPR-associated protein Cmr5